jgi:hypothetical protein
VDAFVSSGPALVLVLFASAWLPRDVVMSYLAFRKGRRLKIRHRLLALSTHHYQTTKLVSKLRRGGEIGETPADITAAIFFTFVAIHMRLYVLAGVEIIHSDSARQAAFRHSNLDYVRKV